jgi:TonB family protein
MCNTWLANSPAGRALSLLVLISLPAPALAAPGASGINLGTFSRISTTVAAISSATTRCSEPNRSAAIVDVAPVEIPEIARLEYAETGWVKVQVDLNAVGALLHTAILRTSGSYALDRAAKSALEKSRYIAETRDCVAVGGSYAVDVNFEN